METNLSCHSCFFVHDKLRCLADIVINKTFFNLPRDFIIIYIHIVFIFLDTEQSHDSVVDKLASF